MEKKERARGLGLEKKYIIKYIEYNVSFIWVDTWTH